MKKEKETRYEKLKAMNISDMAACLSFYFGCDRCPAKKENCSDNDAMCIDTIREWLDQEGQF